MVYTESSSWSLIYTETWPAIEEIETLDDEDFMMSELTDEERWDIQSLNSDDVTSPSPIMPPQAILVEEEQEEDTEESFLVWEPEQDIFGNDRSENQDNQMAWWASTTGVRNICQNPLVWPMSLWGNNRTDEVEALERFLIGRWLLSESNWIFWNDVFEAVKLFQEEFRAEILTPWGVNNPTWYVGRTTIQKIQELACN